MRDFFSFFIQSEFFYFHFFVLFATGWRQQKRRAVHARARADARARAAERRGDLRGRGALRHQERLRVWRRSEAGPEDRAGRREGRGLRPGGGRDSGPAEGPGRGGGVRPVEGEQEICLALFTFFFPLCVCFAVFLSLGRALLSEEVVHDARACTSRAIYLPEADPQQAFFKLF